MADDSRSLGGSTWLLVAVLAATGYVGWQVAPLSSRMDGIDRDRLEMNDRLQREIEKLRDDFERARILAAAGSAADGQRTAAREPAPARSPLAPSAAAPSAAASPAAALAAAPTASAAATRVSLTNAETYFVRRLLPEDAAIATLLVESIPVPEIARRLHHSPAYIVAKAIQIEKQMSAAPDAPPDVLAALHGAVERAKAQR
jgi:hypothetical protein